MTSKEPKKTGSAEPVFYACDGRQRAYTRSLRNSDRDGK